MTTPPIDRLYIVVRGDLAHGYQIAQSCHALREFGESHGDVDASWYASSNTLVVLTVPDEEELLKLYEKASRKRVRCSLFREPDLDDEATALAIEPRGKRLCRSLPLAGGAG